MNRHLTGVMVAVFAAAILINTPAFADHRPGNVVVMGGTISKTGGRAVVAGLILEGRKMYVEELNARGGLLGHKVVLKFYDDRSKKRTALEGYEKLITEDKVDLVLGPYGSFLTDPVANVMERYQQPFVAHASDPAIYERGRKYIFSQPTPFNLDRAEGLLRVAKKIGVKRIALITRAGKAGQYILVGGQRWAKRLGLEVVLVERYPKKQTDFISLLQRIKASGAEALIANAYISQSIPMIRQLRKLNIDVKMLGMLQHAQLVRFTEELGRLAEHVVGYASWWPDPVLGYPGIKEFVEKYGKRYGKLPTYHVTYGYAGMRIMEAAVKEASSFEPEKVREALANISVLTIRGLFKPNEQGKSPVESVAFQIRNGKRLLVWPEHVAQTKVLLMPKWADRAKK
jgi:branched-chain amino acid transport system substrate-binding protein